MNPARPAFEIAGGPVQSLLEALAAGWEQGLAAGLVLYDPAGLPRFETGSFRFHLLRERKTRPGAGRPIAQAHGGLELPHTPCPFDGRSFVEEREIARLRISAREYHVVANRWPVASRHFLVVRPESASPLSQTMAGPEDVEDALRVAAALGPPYRVFFNSNRGIDGSCSGSSVNHWHLQAFPLPLRSGGPLGSGGPPLQRGTNLSAGREASLQWGEFTEWPAKHLLVEAPLQALSDAARFLWKKLLPVVRLGRAYNLEVLAQPEGCVTAFLYPRCPPQEEALAAAELLGRDFGGWELSGEVVVSDARLFAELRGDPERAEALARKRLEGTTYRPREWRRDVLPAARRG